MATIYEWIMSDLIIAKKNEVHLTVDAPPCATRTVRLFQFDVQATSICLSMGTDIGMAR